jgi:hypothetical protein
MFYLTGEDDRKTRRRTTRSLLARSLVRPISRGILSGEQHGLGSDALPFAVAVHPGISSSKAALEGFAIFVLAGFHRSPHDDRKVAAVNAYVHISILRGSVGVGVLLNLD